MARQSRSMSQTRVRSGQPATKCEKNGHGLTCLSDWGNLVERFSTKCQRSTFPSKIWPIWGSKEKHGGSCSTRICSTLIGLLFSTTCPPLLGLLFRGRRFALPIGFLPACITAGPGVASPLTYNDSPQVVHQRRRRPARPGRLGKDMQHAKKHRLC